MVCNVDFLDAFSIVVCNTLTKVKPDHYPIMLTCDFDEFRFMSQFKFLKMWSLNEECTEVIKKTWRNKVFGFPMCILDKKLRVLKANLKVWNKTKFGNVKTKVIEAEKVLKDLQSEIDLIGYNDLLQAKRNEGSK